MRRHPSEFFIKALMLREEDVEQVLDSYELPEADPKYLEKIEKSLKEKPKNFNLNSREKESAQYLRELKIFNLIHPDKYTVEAFSLLSTVDARFHIEKILMSRADSKTTAKKINSKLGTYISEEAIDRYRQYFWNVNIMKMEDWNVIYTDKLERGKIRNIINNGMDYTLHLLGFITQIDLKETLKSIAAQLHYHSEAWKHHPESAEKTKALTSIATALVRIEPSVNTTDSSLRAELKRFEKYRMDHTRFESQGIEAIATIGNYSGSGKELTEGTKIIEMEDEDENYSD